MNRREDWKRKLFKALLLVLVILFPGLLNADPLDNWTMRNPSPTRNNLNGVTYAGETFVAVGDGGTILTSPDGAAWTHRVSGTSAAVEWVTYASGTFVAVGVGGTILTSPDAVAWTPRTSGTSNDLYGVTYASSTFVAVGGAARSSPLRMERHGLQGLQELLIFLLE